MPVANVQIQLVDTPPLNRDYVESELIDLIRRADVIAVMVDLNTDPVQQLEDTVKLLEEYRIVPRSFRETSPEQRGWTFRPFLVLANKCDDGSAEEHFDIFRELLEEEWPSLPVSATTGRNLEAFKEKVVELLEIIRVYSKAPGKEPDLTAPFVLKQGTTVAGFAGKVHKDFQDKLKWAKVWGSGVYEGQMVNRDYVLHDGDVVELHI
jgi:ribosome-interacting GTPase 1